MLTDNFDVFVSYSHQDVDWVRDWLLPRLESAGLRICIDYRDFTIGVPSLDNMTDATVKSRKTLFVMTPDWNISEFSQFEALVTQTIDPIGRKGRLLPLMLKDCDLSARMQILTYADFRNAANWNAELERLIANIREPSDSRSSTTPGKKLAPNLVHPYPLQANFTGRLKEREKLTAWLADEEHPICELVAMGGMGKSALTWYWLTRDVLPGSDANLDGVMWWSFYEGEAAFAGFVDEGLRYVSGQLIDVKQVPMTYDRAQELRRRLQSKRVLFIFDGFERQLRAYANLDAAYQADDVAEKPANARACVDPVISKFIMDIASGTTRAKLLLTTRLPVSDLQDNAGAPLVGVVERELKELARDDAVAFMRDQGVTKGTPEEIGAICETYGDHPLSLRLLSGLIARDPRTPGDIAAAPTHDVRDELIQRRHHILERSYDQLPEEERTLLSRIAAFRSPMSYDALAVFNGFGFLNRPNTKRFDAALEDLRARGLVERDTASNRHDLHPIVRHYAYHRLTDRTGIHTRLRNYFAEIHAPDTEKVQSTEDLAPLIELYHHTIGAGRFDEAAELLRDRFILNGLSSRLGADQLTIELTLALFPDGEDRPPRLKSKHGEAWWISILASPYSRTGHSRRAIALLERSITLAERSGNKRNVKQNIASALVKIAKQQLILGELAGAESNLRRSINLCPEFQGFGEISEALFRQRLSLLLAYRGAFDEEDREFQMALALLERPYQSQSIWVNWSDRALVALLRRDTETALRLARVARTVEDEERIRSERNFNRAEWVLGLALLKEGQNLSDAANHLTEALTRCRRIVFVELEPDIALAWAQWHQAKGNAPEARAYAHQALAIANRCEYRLKQAEIHNFLAGLALSSGNPGKARREAEIAKERAWCDGPPLCYKPALDEAEKMLKEFAPEK